MLVVDKRKPRMQVAAASYFMHHASAGEVATLRCSHCHCDSCVKCAFVQLDLGRPAQQFVSMRPLPSLILSLQEQTRLTWVTTCSKLVSNW